MSLTLTYGAAYSGFTPSVDHTTFHFDNDIVFDQTGVPQCPIASIAVALRAAALAACPGSVVGSGISQYNGGTVNGVIDVFNGQPSSGHPTIYLHDSLNSDALDYTTVGVLTPSSRGGDFGLQADFIWPNTGVALTHLTVTLNNIEPAPGHHYVSAQCGDPDRTVDYAGDFTYYSGGPPFSATATQSCGPTGYRATALKKCKKKHSRAKRRKCRKRANLLPV